MQDQRATTDTDRRLLGALGARDGHASPAELREATALSPRTFTRSLGRLDSAGLLAERSKRIVRLSASAWQLLDPTSRPDADLDVQEPRQAPAPIVRRRTRSRAQPSTAPARDADPDPGAQLEGDDDDLAHIEEDEPPATAPRSTPAKPRTYRAKAPSAPRRPAQRRKPPREPKRTPESTPPPPAAVEPPAEPPRRPHFLEDVIQAIFG